MERKSGAIVRFEGGRSKAAKLYEWLGETGEVHGHV